jgi:hypothetical protein
MRWYVFIAAAALLTACGPNVDHSSFGGCIDLWNADSNHAAQSRIASTSKRSRVVSFGKIDEDTCALVVRAGNESLRFEGGYGSDDTYRWSERSKSVDVRDEIPARVNVDGTLGARTRT